MCRAVGIACRAVKANYEITLNQKFIEQMIVVENMERLV
jgi:hypothetical protein